MQLNEDSMSDVPLDSMSSENEYTPLQQDEDHLMHQTASDTYKKIRNQLFKQFQQLTSTRCADHWEPVASCSPETETLQLYTSRHGIKDTGFCYWRVRGRVEIPDTHLDRLLSDYWPHTRLAWDAAEMENVGVIEVFPKYHIRVVQTLRRDASAGIRKAGGTLGIAWQQHNPVTRARTVMYHSIRQHRHVYPSPPVTCRGMGETWNVAYIQEHTNDASACILDMICKVWSPVQHRFLDSMRERVEESLRRRIHFYEHVNCKWFDFFHPGLVYGSDPPYNHMDDSSPSLADTSFRDLDKHRSESMADK